MKIVSVADELIGGLVAVDLAQRVIDLTGRKAHIRFVDPATFELLWVCGMDFESLEVTESVYETFFLCLTDSRYVFEVLSLVDFHLARGNCPTVSEYKVAREIILTALSLIRDRSGVVSAME